MPQRRESTNQGKGDVGRRRHSETLRRFHEDASTRQALADVTVVAGDEEFRCQRALLACFSPYLRKKLVSADGKPIGKKVHIPQVGKEETEVLLQYMHTGKLGLTCANFLDVYRAASALEMQEVLNECMELLEDRDSLRTYFYTYMVSRRLGDEKSESLSRQLLAHRFEEAICSSHFPHLDLPALVQLISLDTLGARSETLVFLAALRWLGYDYGRRMKQAGDVMRCVRFGAMSMDEVLACHHPPLMPQVLQDSLDVKEMIHEATSYCAAKFMRQDPWFKQYKHTKRNLAFEDLPMQLWTAKCPTAKASGANSTLLVKNQRHSIMKKSKSGPLAAQIPFPKYSMDSIAGSQLSISIPATPKKLQEKKSVSGRAPEKPPLQDPKRKKRKQTRDITIEEQPSAKDPAISTAFYLHKNVAVGKLLQELAEDESSDEDDYVRSSQEVIHSLMKKEGYAGQEIRKIGEQLPEDDRDRTCDLGSSASKSPVDKPETQLHSISQFPFPAFYQVPSEEGDPKSIPPSATETIPKEPFSELIVKRIDNPRVCESDPGPRIPKTPAGIQRVAFSDEQPLIEQHEMSGEVKDGDKKDKKWWNIFGRKKGKKPDKNEI